MDMTRPTCGDQRTAGGSRLSPPGMWPWGLNPVYQALWWPPFSLSHLQKHSEVYIMQFFMKLKQEALLSRSSSPGSTPRAEGPMVAG